MRPALSALTLAVAMLGGALAPWALTAQTPVPTPTPVPAKPVIPVPQPNVEKPALPPPVSPRAGAPLPAPASGCPDPAVASLTARVVRTHTSPLPPFRVTGGVVELVGVVRNEGPVSFRSEPGMQEAVLLSWSRVCTRTLFGPICTTGFGPSQRASFHLLGPGQEAEVRHQIPWHLARGPETTTRLEISYAYDAALGADANARNDDCHMQNNRRELPGVEINRLF